jgi:hypothetical protein
LALIPQVLSHPRLPTKTKQLACGYELYAWFLCYAHGDDDLRSQALSEIRQRIGNWCAKKGRMFDLDRNVRAATATRHPAVDLVAALARVLQPKAGQLAMALNELERCPAWRG